ncbi:hypothetical protein HMPREF3227_01130 [Corynebacterium sp. CMW7794]|nr:hypothetical protein HMPREF3227_01130 [Corynebacterium sp. CMW7794]
MLCLRHGRTDLRRASERGNACALYDHREAGTLIPQCSARRSPPARWVTRLSFDRQFRGAVYSAAAN